MQYTTISLTQAFNLLYRANPKLQREPIAIQFAKANEAKGYKLYIYHNIISPLKTQTLFKFTKIKITAKANSEQKT